MEFPIGTMKSIYNYDHYYLYDEMTEILKNYADKYPHLSELTSLTKTPGGRELWLLKITDTKYGSFEEKPGLCFAGNIHAEEIISSMCLMYYIDHLVTGYETNAKIQRLLRDYTVYVIPRICPDGTEYCFTSDWTCKSNLRMYPFEKMPEGVIPTDLDGDGHVRKMRIKDPKGEWKINPAEPRLFIHREPDEFEGEFYTVLNEGLVNGDIKTCLYDAPNPYTHNYNRNWPYLWQPDTLLNRIDQFGSGEYPLCDPEIKALADFTVETKNLCAFVDFHSCTASIMVPLEMAGTDHANAKDEQRYREIVDMGRAVTGFDTNLKPGPKPGKAAAGGITSDYMHFCRGLVSLTYEAWDQRLKAGATSSIHNKVTTDNDIRYLHWMDTHGYGEEYFKPWTKFNHPQLGEVELGGIEHKHTVMNPSTEYLLPEVQKSAAFLDRFVFTMPRLEVVNAEINLMQGNMFAEDVYELLFTVSNNRYFPTYVTEEARKLNLIKDIEVTLEGNIDGFLVGKRTEKIGQLQGTSDLCGGGMFGYSSQMSSKKPEMEKTVRWLIKVKPGTKLTVHAVSHRAGHVCAEVIVP